MSRTDLRWLAVLTLLIETVTLTLRFGLDLQSTRDTTAVGRFTGGLRIHHGYVGVLLLLGSLVAPESWRAWLRRIGGALIASDLVNHFLVLWPITGSPEFDLVYPDSRG